MDPVDEYFSPYAYVRNNPVRIIDTDGMQETKVASFAKENLIGFKYLSGYNYDTNAWDNKNLVCNEFVYNAYQANGYDIPLVMANQVVWFQDKGWWTTDKNAGQIGDVIFFGDVSTQWKRHEIIIRDTKMVEGVAYYKIMAASSGKGETTLYSNMKWKTMDQLEKWYPDKKFAGIGSVQPEPEAEPVKNEPNIFVSIIQAIFGVSDENNNLTGLNDVFNEKKNNFFDVSACFYF